MALGPVLIALLAAAAVVGTMLAVPALLGDALEEPVQAIELGLDRPTCDPSGGCDPAHPDNEAPASPTPTVSSATATPTATRTPATRQRRETGRTQTGSTSATTSTTRPPYSGGVVVRVRNNRNLLLGFRGQVTIQNMGSEPVNGWVLTFFYEDVQITMTSGADGRYESDGRFRATPLEHNRVIRPRDSVGFQFEATGDPDTRPTGCQLNDRPCTFG